MKETDEAYKIVFEALEKSSGIDEIIKYIADNLKISIAFINPCGKVLTQTNAGCSGSNVIGAEVWQQLLERYFENDDEEDYVSCRTDKLRHVMSPILWHNSLEGFCVTSCDIEMDMTNAVWMNQLIRRALNMNMGRKKHSYNVKASTTKQTISRILFGSDDTLEERFQISDEVYDAYMKPPYVLGMIKLPQSAHVLVQRVYNQLSACFANSLVYLEETELWFIVNQVEACEQLIDELQEIVGKCECICGVSMRFFDRHDIESKKKVIKRLIEIGPKRNALDHLFTEFKYYLDLVCSYAFEEIGGKGYQWHVLDRIEKEDREKGTEFYHTLLVYLMNGNTVNLAAKELFIHRNTMVYRLAKISEMFEVDINDPSVSKRLLVSMILRSF